VIVLISIELIYILSRNTEGALLRVMRTLRFDVFSHRCQFIIHFKNNLLNILQNFLAVGTLTSEPYAGTVASYPDYYNLSSSLVCTFLCI
jgi:hypothetical protein